jgi:hypothetical protein
MDIFRKLNDKSGGFKKEMNDFKYETVTKLEDIHGIATSRVTFE